MLTLNTTIDALKIQSALQPVDRRIGTQVQRLSSGIQINSAKDNAAGLSLTNVMTSQIRGLEMAMRGSADAVNLLKTADGATVEITNMLQRMRELTVQAMSGTYTDSQRGLLNSEFQELKSQIVAISKNTTWNDRKILTTEMPLVTTSSTYVEYSDYGSAAETLSLTSAASASTAAGAITVVAGKVYKGTGFSAYKLGELDATNNGVAGKPLRINFVSAADPATQFLNPSNGHYYEVVNTTGVTWAQAKADAEARSLLGMPGYLATISDSTEQAFINSKLSGQEGWIGASDEQTEGAWKWVSGPESDTNFYNGAVGGTTVTGQYANWDSGEPNNLGNEDYAYIRGNGKWNDYSGASVVTSYVIEYGAGGATPTTTLSSSEIAAITSKVNYADTLASTRTNDLTIQIGANQGQTLTISLADFSERGAITSGVTVDYSATAAAKTVRIDTASQAQSALSKLDTAIDNVDQARSSFGASINGMNSILDNLVDISNNLHRSRSKVLDTDYAHEASELSKDQVLLQAGQAAMKQAYFDQEMVLKMLGAKD